MRRARRGFQRQAPNQRRVSRGGAGAPALAITRKEEQHSSMLRARTVPRWSWSACVLRKPPAPTGGRSPSSRARCDVQAAVFNAKLAQRASRSAGALALAVTGEEAQHSGLLRARRTGCFWSAHELSNGTAPTRGLSPSVRARCATRQTWLPTPSAKPAPRVTRRRRTGTCCH